MAFSLLSRNRIAQALRNQRTSSKKASSESASKSRANKTFKFEPLEDRQLLSINPLNITGSNPPQPIETFINANFQTNNQENQVVAIRPWTTAVVAGQIVPAASTEGIVVWQSNGVDNAGFGIQAQRFNPAANAATNPLVGVNVPVNTTTAGDQTNPAVAIQGGTATGTGNVVIAWNSATTADPDGGIVLRRFTAAMAQATNGQEFLVNTTIAGVQSNPSIAIDNSDGSFLVVWETTSTDGTGKNIFGRYFASAATGGAAPNEFQIAGGAGDQFNPVVAVDGDGDFVVVWESDVTGEGRNIIGRHFTKDPNLPPGGSEFTIAGGAGNQSNPAVSMRPDGSFVTVWQASDAALDADGGIFGREYTGTLTGNQLPTPAAAAFLVNSVTTGLQINPSVAVHNVPTNAVANNNARGFVISWQGPEGAGLGQGSYARGYTANSTPRGPDTIIHSTPRSGDQTIPTVAMDAFGEGFIAYTSTTGADTSPTGVYAMRYTKLNATPIATDIVINVNEDESAKNILLTLPGIATDADNDALTFSNLGGGTGVLPQNGLLQINTAVTNTFATGNVLYTPNTDFFGTDRFTYTVTDGTVTSNVGIVEINVLPSNDAPVIAASGPVLTINSATNPITITTPAAHNLSNTQRILVSGLMVFNTLASATVDATTGAIRFTTTQAHGLSTGDRITIANALGSATFPNVNGSRLVTVVSANVFELRGITAPAGATYTANSGRLERLSPANGYRNIQGVTANSFQLTGVTPAIFGGTHIADRKITLASASAGPGNVIQFNSPNHGLINGGVVRFTNVAFGTLNPQPLLANTDYRVFVVDANNFRVVNSNFPAAPNTYTPNSGQAVVPTGEWEVAPLSGLISNATNAAAGQPIVITTVGNHGLAAGQLVQILGVQGNNSANTIGTQYFRVAANPAPGANTFALLNLQGIPVSGTGAYTGGGQWRAVDSSNITNITGTGPLTITANGHGLASNDTVTITGALVGTNITAVTDVGQGQPSVVTTSAAHGLQTGQRITIDDVWRGANVSTSTNTTPIKITTSTAHRLATGDKVVIAGVTGNTNANNTADNPEWVVEFVDADEFLLFKDDAAHTPSSGNSAVSTGGTYRSRSTINSEQPLDRVVRVLSATTFEVQQYFDETFNLAASNITSAGGVVRINATASDFDVDARQGQLTLSGVYVGDNLSAAPAVGAGVAIRYTSTAHNLQTGDRIKIGGVTGAGTYGSSSNGLFTVTRIDANTFSIPVPFVSGTYNANSGKWVKVDATDTPILSSVNGTYRTDGVDVNQIDLIGSVFAGPNLFLAADLPKVGLPAARWTGNGVVQLNEGGTGQGAVLTGIAFHNTTANWNAPSAANGTWVVTVTGPNTFTIPATANGTFVPNLADNGAILSSFTRGVTAFYTQGVGQQSIAIAGLAAGPANELTQPITSVTATSDFPALVPNPVIFFPDSDPTRLRLQVNPTNGVGGTANITVTFSDGALTHSEVVKIQINNPPTLNGQVGPPIQFLEDSVNNFITITGINEGALGIEDFQNLRLRAVALDPVTNLPSQARITDPWVSYTQNSSTAIIGFDTVANAVGPVRIRVYAEDDSGANNFSTFRDFDINILGVADTPFIQDVITNQNVQSGLIQVTNNGADTTAYRVQNIFGGRLFLSTGVEVFEGTWVTTAQVTGANGLRFTPATNSVVAGSFELLPSTNAIVGSQELGVTPGIAPAVGHIYIATPQGGGTGVGQVVSGAGGNFQATATATDAKGNYVVVYVGQNDANSQSDLFMRRYDANGVVLGGSVSLDSDNTNANFNFDPAIAMDPDGDFVVVWADQLPNAGLAGSNLTEINGRRFDAQGNPKGGHFRVNTTTTNSQFDPSVAIDAQGNFIVTWTSTDQGSGGINDDNLATDNSTGIYAQRFNFNNDPIGREFLVNVAGAGGVPTGNQGRSSVSMDAEGNFMIAWESQGQGAAAPSIADTDGYSIRAQRYDKAGNRIGVRELQLLTVGGTMPAGQGEFTLNLGNKSTTVSLTLPANAANFAANTAALQAAVNTLAPGASVNTDVRVASNGTTQFYVTMPDGGGIDHGAFNSATANLLDWPQFTALIKGGHFTVAVAIQEANQGAPTNNNIVLAGTQYPSDEVQRIQFTNNASPVTNEGASLLITVPGLTAAPIQVIYSNNQDLTIQRIQAALDAVSPGDFKVVRHVGDITALTNVVGPTVQITSPLHGLAAPAASPFQDRVEISGVKVGANFTAGQVANNRAADVVITSNAHGFTNGQKVTLSGIRVGGQLANVTLDPSGSGIRLNQTAHGLVAGDTITIEGAAGTGAFANGALNGTYQVVPMTGTGTIASISQASPGVFTSATPHGLVTGQMIVISGVSGTNAAAINGPTARAVTVISPTTFSIAVNTTGANTGGTWTTVAASANAFQIVPLTTIPPGTAAAYTANSGWWSKNAAHLNGDFFAGAVTANTFKIYADQALTQPVQGTGGAHMSTSGRWDRDSNINGTWSIRLIDAHNFTIFNPVTNVGPANFGGTWTTGTGSWKLVSNGLQPTPQVKWSIDIGFTGKYGTRDVPSITITGAGASRVAAADRNGTPSEFRVNTTIAGNQRNPSVALAPSGDFMVAFEHHVTANTDSDVYARLFNSAGIVTNTTPTNANRNDFRVNVTTPGNQTAPKVLGTPDGNYVITWHNNTDANSLAARILARPYDKVGTPGNAVELVPVDAFDPDNNNTTPAPYGASIDRAGRISVSLVQAVGGVSSVFERTVSLDMPSTVPLFNSSGAISGISGTANPITILANNHNLVSGQIVSISGILGTTSANGVFAITVIDNNSFSIPVAANGPYGGGGRWAVVPVNGTTPIQITSSNHGLQTGDQVVVTGVRVGAQITDASTPIGGTDIVVTSVGHGLVTGDTVAISGVQGNTNANGLSRVVTVLSPDTFLLNGTAFSNGAYVAGTGVWTKNSTVANANGRFIVTRLDNNRFALNGSAGNGPYIGGAYTTAVSDLIQDVTNTSPIIVTTTTAHGLSVGDTVLINNVGGNVAANGAHTVVPISGLVSNVSDDNSGGTITSISQASPGVFTTSAPHGLVTGQFITIAGVTAGPNIAAINGLRQVTVTSATQFNIGLNTGAGNTGANITWTLTAGPTTPIIVTAPEHRLVNGQQINITGVAGNTAANGLQTVAPAQGLIATISNATPPVVTTNDHGLRNAEIVTVRGVVVGANITAAVGATAGVPIQFTSNAHGLVTGDSITIAGVAGTGAFSNPNATNYTVTVVNANVFTVSQSGNPLNGIAGSTYTAFSGVWMKNGVTANPNGVRLVQASATNTFTLVDSVTLAPIAANGPYMVNGPDLAKLGLPAATWVFGRSGAVTGATNAANTPIRITNGTANHLLSDSNEVLIANVGGNAAANGTRFVKVISATEFDLYADRELTQPVLGNGTYTTGGTWQQKDLGLDSFSLVGTTSNGDYVADTGTWAATSLSGRSFALAGTVGNGAYQPGTGRYTLPFENTPPIAASVYLGRNLPGLDPTFREDLQPINNGEKLQLGIEKIVVTFSEDLNVAFPANSVTNPANWQLFRNQVVGGPTNLDVSSLISGITFGINPVTNRYEAVLTFSVLLPQGDYLLRAKSTITDIAGNALDGDLDGKAGGDFDVRFSSLGQTPAGPEQVVHPAFQFADQTNSGVASDANGNYVVVWQSSNHTLEAGSSSIWGRRYLKQEAPLSDVPLGALESQRLQFTGTPSTSGGSKFTLSYTNSAGVVRTTPQIVYTNTIANLTGPIRKELELLFAQDGLLLGNVAGVLVGGLAQINITFAGVGIDRPQITATPVPGAPPFGIDSTTLVEGGSNSEFKINTLTNGDQINPKVAMSDDGRFVVVWEGPAAVNTSGSEIYMQRYNANGTAAGVEVRVNTATAEIQNQPSVDMAPDGSFVVVWRSTVVDGSDGGIRMQRYNAAGAAQGGEVAVNNLTLGDQSNPDVVVGDEGTIMVAWQGPDSKIAISAVNNLTGANLGITANGHGLVAGSRILISGIGYTDVANHPELDPNGIHTVVGDPPNANTFFIEINGDPTAQYLLSNAEFVLLVETTPGSGIFVEPGMGIFAKRFDRNGAVINTNGAASLRVNTTLVGDQTNPIVEADADGGRFVVAWNSPDGAGNGTGIFSQMFRPDVAGSPGGLKVGTLNEIQRLQFINTPPALNARFRITFNGVQTTEITFANTDELLTAQRIVEAMAAIGVAVKVTPGFTPSPQTDFLIEFLTEGTNVATIAVAMTAGGGTPQVTAGNTPPTREGGSGLGGFEIQINSTSAGNQSNQQIAMDRDGDTVYTWLSGGEVIARRFNVLGGPQTPEFVVNTPTAVAELAPAVAVDPDGNMVVSWTTDVVGPPDVDQEVYVRRFRPTTLPPVLPTGSPGGPYTVDEGGTVALSAAATAGLTYTWDLDGDNIFGETGSGAIRGDETGLTPVYNAGGTNAALRPNGPGTQTVRFRVDDGVGGVLTLPVDITIVNIGPTVPTFDAGPGVGGSYDVLEGSLVTLTASGSTDPGPDTVIYQWDLDGDGIFGEASTARGAEVGASVSFTAAGLDGSTGAVVTPAVTVRAFDGTTGSAASTSRVINIINVQPTPNAGGPYTVAEGGTVNLSGSATDPGNDSVTVWAWDLDGDGIFGNAAGSRGNESVQNPVFNAAGLDGAAGVTFAVKLRVNDGEGGALQTEATVNISITNAAPTVNAGGPYVVLQDGSVQLNGASVSDPAGALDPLMLTWDLDGDGTFGETVAGPAPNQGNRGVETGLSPTFDATGISVGTVVTVFFRANDGDGGITTGTTTITVQAIGGGASAIIDDEEAGYNNTPLVSWTETTGTGHAGIDLQNDYYSTLDSAAEATWEFTVPGGPGQYRVSATWANSATLTTAAPYEVLDGTAAGGVSRGTVLRDQTTAPNDFTNSGSVWEDLGFFNITSGSLSVKLTAPADGRRFIADAIRIERITSLPAAAEVQVTESGNNIVDGTGTVDYGTVSLGNAVTKTFEVSNSGLATLTLGAITFPAGFTLVTPLGSTSLTSGQSTTFQLRMDSAAIGSFSGTVSVVTSDSDENPFDFQVSGVVAAFQIIDDTDTPPALPTDPGFRLSDPNAWGPQIGTGREGDFHYSLDGYADQEATWTFNVTPGVYRVSATWANGLPATFASNARFSVLDGALPRSSSLMNLRNSPNDFVDQGSSWEDLGTSVNISGSQLVVKLSATGADGMVFADAIRVERISNLPAGSEIAVSVGNVDVPDNTGFVDFGTTHVGTPVDITFTISNSGSSPLTVGTLSAMPNGFSLLGPGPLASVPTGGITTFTVRLDATVHNTGVLPYSGTISFTTNDGDESPYNFTIQGVVVAAQVVDNGPGPGYTATADFSSNSGAMYLNDYDTALSTSPPTAQATWTFTVTPGQYRVAATWTEFLFWTSAAPYTVWDGNTATGTNLGLFTKNQKSAPNDLIGADGANWEYLGGVFDITGTTLTVTLAVGADGSTVADAIRIQRLDGGGNSEGNSEGLGLAMATSSSGGTLRGGPQSSAVDAALANAFWSDDMDDVAAVLAEDAGTDSGLSDDLASSSSDSETEALDLALAGWLD